MRRGLWAILAAVAVVSAPGCSGSSGTGASRTARVNLVQTGDARYDAFFRAVHEVQVALNEAARIRINTQTRLADALGLIESADLDATMARIRERTEQLRTAGVRVVVTTDAQRAALSALVLDEDDTARVTDISADAAVGATDAVGAADAGDAVVAADVPPPAPVAPLLSQPDAEAAVVVDVELQGASVALDQRQFAEAVRVALRRTIALRRRLDAIGEGVGSLRADGEALGRTLTARLGARASAIALELHDALEFLDGATSWARAEALTTERVSALILGSASLHGGS